MKWLILFVLISCGHETPPAQDTADSDGDQIPNYLEGNSELQKFTASITPYGEMKGTLTFKADLQVVSVDLTNESDLYRTSFTLLTRRTELLNKEGHFSEWATLRLKSERPQVNITEADYEVTLRFPESSEKPDHIVFGDSVIGEFKPVMRFHLKKKEMEDFLSSRTFLSMRRKGSETPWSQDANVRQRTYRVFLNDGKTTNVYYVSRELPLERFLVLMNVENPRYLDDEGKLGWHDEGTDWWVRDVGDRDKVVVRASEKDIAAAREKNFVKSVQQVQRVNGKRTHITQIEKPSDARLILKLRGTKETRTFVEAYNTYKRGGGHEQGKMTCHEWSRAINSSGNLPLQSDELLRSIVLTTGAEVYTPEALGAMAVEAHDEEGLYLELALRTSEKLVQIKIPDRPDTTYTRTGIYQFECDAIPRRNGGDVTNDEGHFSVRVDAYIEKLQD